MFRSSRAPIVHQFGQGLGVRIELQQPGPGREEWLHAVHRDSQQITRKIVTSGATIGWKSHLKRTTQVAGFSHPTAGQRRIADDLTADLVAGWNRMHLQDVSVRSSD